MHMTHKNSFHRFTIHLRYTRVKYHHSKTLKNDLLAIARKRFFDEARNKMKRFKELMGAIAFVALLKSLFSLFVYIWDIASKK